MPIIECYDCGAAVSDSAESCPHCGFPVRNRQGNLFQRLSREPKVTFSRLDVAKSMLGRLVIGALLFAAGSDVHSTLLALTGIGVAGSVVPLWFKGLNSGRLSERSGSPTLGDSVNRALANAEERDMQRLADIEQNANRILDLEERLEFTERLLAMQREEREKLGPRG